MSKAGDRHSRTSGRRSGADDDARGNQRGWRSRACLGGVRERRLQESGESYKEMRTQICSWGQQVSQGDQGISAKWCGWGDSRGREVRGAEGMLFREVRYKVVVWVPRVGGGRQRFTPHHTQSSWKEAM